MKHCFICVFNIRKPQTIAFTICGLLFFLLIFNLATLKQLFRLIQMKYCPEEYKFFASEGLLQSGWVRKTYAQEAI